MSWAGDGRPQLWIYTAPAVVIGVPAAAGRLTGIRERIALSHGSDLHDTG
jgi:hypothetical protein